MSKPAFERMRRTRRRIRSLDADEARVLAADLATPLGNFPEFDIPFEPFSPRPERREVPPQLLIRDDCMPAPDWNRYGKFVAAVIASGTYDPMIVADWLEADQPSKPQRLNFPWQCLCRRHLTYRDQLFDRRTLRGAADAVIDALGLRISVQHHNGSGIIPFSESVVGRLTPREDRKDGFWLVETSTSVRPPLPQSVITQRIATIVDLATRRVLYTHPTAYYEPHCIDVRPNWITLNTRVYEDGHAIWGPAIATRTLRQLEKWLRKHCPMYDTFRQRDPDQFS